MQLRYLRYAVIEQVQAQFEDYWHPFKVQCWQTDDNELAMSKPSASFGLSKAPVKATCLISDSVSGKAVSPKFLIKRREYERSPTKPFTIAVEDSTAKFWTAGIL